MTKVTGHPLIPSGCRRGSLRSVGRHALRLMLLAVAGGACTTGPGDGAPSEVWRIAEPGASHQQPYADGSIVVFTLESRRVVALRPHTGERIWSTQLPPLTPGGPFGNMPPRGAPVGAGDLILVPGWDLYALDRATGAIRWVVGSETDYPATGPITVAGDLVLSLGARGNLRAVDRASGTPRWLVNIGEQLFSAAISGGMLFTGGRMDVGGGGLGLGHLWAIDAQTGAVRWRALIGDTSRPLLGGTIGRPLVAGPDVIVTGVDGGVYAFDAATGSPRWVHDGGQEHLASGPVLIDTVIVTANGAGDVRGLRAATGERLWESSILSVVSWQITTAADLAFLVPGTLVAYGADGRRRWTYGGSRDGIYFSTPATIVDGVVYLAANNAFAGASGGGLFALRIDP